MQKPKTRRGEERRDAIVHAAAKLIYERGLRGTSLEDILRAADAGKSQMYHYFSSKDDLAAAVLEHQLAQVLGQQQQFRLETWSGLRAWFDALLEGQKARELRGCPVGSLAVEMSATSEELKARVADAFLRWQSTLEQAFEKMRSRGLIETDATPAELAQTTLAAIQGGYLLSTAEQDLQPMARSLKLAYTHLRSLIPKPSP
ncbi:MAG: TetR family transcriptional regulator [Solirubrobacterales bacterium]|nr:MAG: TetR family transcriptional regulator [Solirubrobacterales bacterium]PZS14277.1 MAG: TetR family transcriptional regulator [Solirubrobacterales bacterium]